MFFCDILGNDDRQVAESRFFVARYSEVPVTDGNCEIYFKKHQASLFEIGDEEWQDLWNITKDVKLAIEKDYKPDGYNFGMNEGRAAGRSVDHLHFHLIPRYEGDVENPRGGIRNVIPDKGDYYKYILDKFPDRKKYINK